MCEVLKKLRKEWAKPAAVYHFGAITHGLVKADAAVALAVREAGH